LHLLDSIIFDVNFILGAPHHECLPSCLTHIHDAAGDAFVFTALYGYSTSS